MNDHTLPALPTIDVSNAWFARARGLIPAYTQTLAKGPGQHVRGVAPKFLERGLGCHVWDVDGNELLDWTMAVGPLSLGYGDPVVDAAIRSQLEKGITFSLPSTLEVEVAELVREMVPGAECVRYSKTGCDVTSAAVRLARAFTGRDLVLSCGYHGWHDWYIGVTDRDRGVPRAVKDLTFTFPYGNLEALDAALDDDVACVIMEPMTFQAPPRGYLEGVKELCRKRGALLIFDEMWTGFRLALGGAQERFGVTADLACFSKAVANGMPLSILTGREDVMQLLSHDVFFFTTFGGEALSLAAARATMTELRRRSVPDQLARQGRMLREGYLAIASRLALPFTSCIGMDARTMVTFDAAYGEPLAIKSLVQQELLRRGILWNGFHNVSAAHDDAAIHTTLAAYADVLPYVADAVEQGDVFARLRGEPVEPVFRRTQGFDQRPRRRL